MARSAPQTVSQNCSSPAERGGGLDFLPEGSPHGYVISGQKVQTSMKVFFFFFFEARRRRLS